MTDLTRRGDPAAIRAIGHVSTLCGVVASLMIFASVLITCQMIFLRAVMGQSTVWQTEAVIYLMIGATLLGLPYVQKLRGHVGVDLVPEMLPAAARRVLASLVLVATIVMIGLMLFYGWEMFHVAWERNWRSETVWGVKLWIPYLAVPLGFALFALQLAADLWAVATGHEAAVADVAPEDRRH